MKRHGFSRDAPLLVTGMPRSGTTWLARLLASAPGVALTGREPMNPRGRQYALAGTLDGWTRLVAPTARQRGALRTSYSGLNPLVYSRYGHRQWAAVLPGTRLVVKDPFAMLSIPVVQELTNARPVLLFRHPGAALASYRRMGWSPDVSELTPIIDRFIEINGPTPGVARFPVGAGEVGAMAWFWNALYGIALSDVNRLDKDLVVLAHEDIAAGGERFAAELFRHLGLEWEPSVAQNLKATGGSRLVNENALHNFDRNPAQVAHEWEKKLAKGERVGLEQETHTVLSMLRERAFRRVWSASSDTGLGPQQRRKESRDES